MRDKKSIASLSDHTNYKKLKTLELFAGGGGMALGARFSGYESILALEYEKNSCSTLRLNSPLLFESSEPLVHEGDVREFIPDPKVHNIDLLLGGPPCQPFSIGGHKKGFDDSRDLFPEYIRILSNLKPKAFLIENVKGITAKRFSDYLNFIHLQLRYVDILPKKSDTWEGHYKKLLKVNGSPHSSSYTVQSTILNAVNYGVPQSRERVFIIGFRSDLNIEWKWPKETHSKEALLYSMYVDQSYSKNHKISSMKTPPELAPIINKLERMGKPNTLPHKTVRDALIGLPVPTMDKPHPKFHNHKGIDGARSYPGHTGSYLDLPAKTLKAGVHGCPGGENMVLYPDGKVRYFSVREAARMQTFPDDYVFVGSRSECMRQIGNAVPVELAKVLTGSIKRHLTESKELKKSVKRISAPHEQLSLLDYSP